jgi:hypothetical protein
MSSTSILALARKRLDATEAATPAIVHKLMAVDRLAKATPPPEPAITIPCAKCGITSRHFLEIINPEGWMCDACWPAWPDDAAYEGEERAAMMTGGDAKAIALHYLPTSWADATIEPTDGARCRCCSGRVWWTEARHPRGWRCTICHPPSGLTADQFRTAP